MDIRGFLGLTTLDFPHHLASIVYVGGCNFRCPYCYNMPLVLRQVEALDEGDVWSRLSERRAFIDGVVITGGEPSLQPDLLDFMDRVKSLGLLVKLDTNGSRPEVLAEAIRRHLLDYVAVDIKLPLRRYGELTAEPEVAAKVQATVELLRKDCAPENRPPHARRGVAQPPSAVRSTPLVSAYPTAEGGCATLPLSTGQVEPPVMAYSYEFRTTIHPRLLSIADLEEIAQWLAGADPYYLQPFAPFGALDPALEQEPPYSRDQLDDLLSRVRRWLPNVQLRETNPA